MSKNLLGLKGAAGGGAGMMTVNRVQAKNAAVIKRAVKMKKWIEMVLGERLPAGDLGVVLRDGTVLCRLLNACREKTVRRFHYPVSVEHPFKGAENIGLFIEALEKMDIMHDVCVPEVIDLYENRNMVRFVNALQHLCNYDYQNNEREHNFSDFTLEGSKLDPSKKFEADKAKREAEERADKERMAREKQRLIEERERLERERKEKEELERELERLRRERQAADAALKEAAEREAAERAQLESERAARAALEARQREAAERARQEVEKELGSFDLSEAALFEELNRCRSDPAGYSKVLETYRLPFFHKRILCIPGVKKVETKEGPEAVKECMEWLMKQEPLHHLVVSEGMTRAARECIEEHSAGGKVGADSIDRLDKYGRFKTEAIELCAYGGENARDVIMRILVSDGDKSREKRKVLFDACWKCCGVATGMHNSKYKNMSIISLTCDFVPKQSMFD